MQYRALTQKDGKRTVIEFPDCPGCGTFAEASEEVCVVAREALEAWIETMLDDGAAPPRPDSATNVNVPVGAKALYVDIDSALEVRLQIRWARERAGMSQGELAALMNVPRQQVSRLESSDGNVTMRTLERVAAALRIAPALTIGIGPFLAARVGALLMEREIYTTVNHTMSDPLQITVTDPQQRDDGQWVGYVYQLASDDVDAELTARKIVDGFFRTMRGPGRATTRIL